jgi:membrane protease YdiL (CAAX protease family)
MVAASLGVAIAAGLSAAASGASPTQTLADPAKSPLVNSPTWISVGTIANEAAVVGTLLFWWWVLKPQREAVLPLGRPSLLGVVGAVLAVFGLAPLAEVAGELTHRLLGNEVTASHIVVNAARGASGAGVLLLFFSVAVLPALAEEALFRGLLTAPFEKRFVLGLVVPSVLFGLFHLEPTQVAGTIVLGVGFAAARLCTGTLLTGAIAHLLYNGAVVLAVRYSDAMAERELAWPPVLVGLGLAGLGSLLLWRERRVLLARRSGARVAMPSWWI